MRIHRPLALVFALILVLTPVLEACQRQPSPKPATSAPSTSVATAAQASAAQPAPATATQAPSAMPATAAPTEVPTPAPTRAPLPPVVTSITPVPGETLKLDSPVTISFDQPMDPASTTKAFAIDPPVPGQVSVQGSELIFKPEREFKRAAEYQVRLDTNASSAGGLKMLQPVTYKVQTAGFLQVTGSQPADQTADVPVDTKITVSFNQPVVPLTGVREQAGLPNPLVITPTLAGKGEWLGTSIYQFTPERGLSAASQYSVTVKAGLAGTTGTLLEKDYSFGFSTAHPGVIAWLPETPNAMKPDVPISATFSMPMERASTEQAFQLTDNQGRALEGKFNWNADGTQLGFKPARMLDFGARYRASVSSVARPANGQGTMLSEAQYPFTTVPLPKIVGSDPPQGSQNANPYGGLAIRFASPMDQSTFVTGTVTILPKPTQVYTNYNDYDNAFYINFDKLPNTPYTVTVSGRLADPYGNTLGKDYILRFKTRHYDPSYMLNSPGMLGTYNAYTKTEAIITYMNIGQVTFALYRVAPDLFLRLSGRNYYDALNNFKPAERDLIRQWNIQPKGPLDKGGILGTPLVDQNGKQLAPGLYYLTIAAPPALNGAPQPDRARQLLARTDLNVTLKTTESSALAWVTDLKSGQPVAGVKVQFTDGAKVDTTATTDKNGIAEVTFARREQSWEPLMALATGSNGQLGVASSVWNNGIGPWNFNLAGGGVTMPYNGYVYTDRPIYRPGQTVYWKAIIRSDNDAQYTLPPPGQPVTITIRDAQGNVLSEQRVKLNALGAADGKLDLGPEAGLGYYNINAQLAKDVQFGVGFQVNEYRKPDYQIAAATAKPEYIQGEQFQAGVTASYFFGGPVKNARVRWILMSNDYTFEYQQPKQATEPVQYTFGDWDWFDYERTRPFGGPLGQGEGRTDASGQFTMTVPADISRFSQSQRFTVDFTITDANNQAVSAQASAIVHKGDFYIGMHPQSYVSTANEQNAVDIIVVDTKSKPVPDTRLTVVANSITWYSVRERAEDGNYYWTSKARKTAIFTDTLTTGRDGTAVFRWRPDKSGEYKIEAGARDSAGHAIRGAAFTWVSSEEYAYWRQDNNDRIQLVADKEEYRPGDTAQVLVASPYQGKVKALLTFERNNVLSHEVIELATNSEVLRVPIRPDYAPNVYVSLVLVKGMDATNPMPSFKLGLAQLKISVADKELQVVAQPDRKQVGPRETVTWDIEARNAAGKPVPNAEVSLAMVDKAILTLADDQAGPIVNRFYSNRALGVTTASTLVVNIDRMQVQLSRAAAKGGGGGGEGGLQPVRREFPDVAYWNAAVTTGADGKAQVKVTLPDNLTTWTLDARAVTPDTLVGQSKTDIVATKELLVRPVLPRFFILGDQATIGAVVHNNTTQPLDVNIDMRATGLQPASPDTAKRVTIPAQSTYKAEWPVTVRPALGQAPLLEEVKVTMSATGGALNDAIETTLPVYRYTTPEVTGTSGQVNLDEPRLELVRLPADADPSRGELDVTLEPSLAAGMTGGLNYLEHYPYECVEQTLSRFLPNVVTYQALKSLGLQRPDLEKTLPQQVAVGLQRLYARQHVDGGWGWFMQDRSNTFVTSYVVFGLAKAQRAGFAVDQEVLRRGVEWLGRQLRAPKDLKPYELNDQAFILYALALAGNPQPNRAGALFEARDRLSTYAQAYLALALGQINDAASQERIKTLMAGISGKAITSATTTHWEEAWTDYASMNTDTRTTSIVLDAISVLDPKNALAPNTVRWLMVARQGNRWQTTQENAWAIMSLTDWMVSSGELEGNYDWNVKLNDGALGNGTVTPQTVDQVVQLRAAVGQQLLGSGTNSLLLERTAAGGQTGKGQLYYTAHLKSFLPVDQIDAQSRGVSVSRQYQMADCGQSKTGQAAAPGSDKAGPPAENTCPPVTAARVGDVLNVKLQIVVPSTVYYLVLEDWLPAGTEAIDTSLRTTSQAAQGPEIQKAEPVKGKQTPGWYPYWWWTPTNTELRDEKTVLFANEISPGTYEFNYQVRATLPGKFQTLPPTAYAMYYPEVQGRGAGSIFTVTEP